MTIYKLLIDADPPEDELLLLKNYASPPLIPRVGELVNCSEYGVVGEVKQIEYTYDSVFYVEDVIEICLVVSIVKDNRRNKGKDAPQLT